MSAKQKLQYFSKCEINHREGCMAIINLWRHFVLESSDSQKDLEVIVANHLSMTFLAQYGSERA